jgi:hypothetical protein
MPDLMEMAKDRRAKIVAEQAKLAAELARLDEFVRMAGILTEYELGESEEVAREVFSVRIAGLASGRETPGDNADGSDYLQLKGPNRSAAGTGESGTAKAPKSSDSSGAAASPPPVDMPATDQDHFEF